MSEQQIHDIVVTREDMSHFDTGGGFRRVMVAVIVDSSIPIERQKVTVTHEILGAYIGSVVGREDIEEMAESIVEALNQLEAQE